MYKKIFFWALAVILLLPTVSFAQLADSIPPNAPVINIPNVIASIINAVWIVMAAVAVIMFAFAGLTFLTAAGSPEKIKLARTSALWGVVGVIVMILAFSIFQIITNLL